MRNVTLLVFAGLWFCSPLSSLAQNETTLEGPCIRENQFAIAGITINSSKEETIRIFGEPLRSTYWYEEFFFEYMRKLEYRGLVIELVADKVTYIKCESPKWATPDGLRVGDSIKKIEETLGPGKVHHSNRGYEIRYIVGPPFSSCEMILLIKEGKICSIELWLDLS